MLKLIEESISEIGSQSISATCSISIYHIDENIPDNPNEIIARAERNLDKIQREGGNQASIYVPVAGEMTQEEQDGEIARTIKSAISNNSVRAMYQPIVSITGEGGERYQLEIAIRTESGEELTATDYMESAERSGTAKTLDRWCVVHAIKQISKAVQAGRKLNLFINLSNDSLKDPALARWIAQRIQSAKIPGEQLVFTISEAHAVNQLKSAKALYKGLKQLHCQIVLDDFGTGLKPFQLVKHIQPDYLRISPAFVNGLAGNNENQNSIREINNQASSMEIRSIVPGVADASILSVLWSVGADFVQGDFLQAPSENMSYDFTSMSG